VFLEHIQRDTSPPIHTHTLYALTHTHMHTIILGGAEGPRRVDGDGHGVRGGGGGVPHEAAAVPQAHRPVLYQPLQHRTRRPPRIREPQWGMRMVHRCLHLQAKNHHTKKRKAAQRRSGAHVKLVRRLQTSFSSSVHHHCSCMAGKTKRSRWPLPKYRNRFSKTTRIKQQEMRRDGADASPDDLDGGLVDLIHDEDVARPDGLHQRGVLPRHHTGTPPPPGPGGGACDIRGGGVTGDWSVTAGSDMSPGPSPLSRALRTRGAAGDCDPRGLTDRRGLWNGRGFCFFQSSRKRGWQKSDHQLNALRL